MAVNNKKLQVTESDFDNIKENSLDSLFSYYNTDKANLFNNGKDKGHGYAKFYETHLNKFKYREIKILEIGSFSGASAAAFVKFFRNAEIYCLDVNLTSVKYKSDKINFFGIDSSNTKMLDKFLKIIKKKFFVKKFDVIIDDGLHTYDANINTFEVLINLLSEDGGRKNIATSS